MATPFDVVSKHRFHAWLFFALIVLGFLALCIGTTVWHALQRNHPAVAEKYIDGPVGLGDISICLTNEWGYFPLGLTGISASCQVGPNFQVPAVEALNSTVQLSSKPPSLSSQPIFADGVSSFQANEAGCTISQSFRTGLLGDVPKNCFRFETNRVGFQSNTTVTLFVAYQNSNFTSGSTYDIDNVYLGAAPGSISHLALFTDGLNGWDNFEVTYQAINSSNLNQLQPSVRRNLKAYPDGNTTATLANPISTPLNFGGTAGSVLSTSNTYVQMVINTTPQGYLQITEQDPLTALVLLPAYGGFWPYFLVCFSIFFSAEPTMGLRPFLVRWTTRAWHKVRPPKPQRASSVLPMNLGQVDSAAPGLSDGPADGMTESERRERAYMAAQNDKFAGL